MKPQAFRLLVVVVGVGVLAIGLSLRLEGAPPAPRKERGGHNSSSDVSRETTITKVKALTASRAAPAVPTESTSRVKVGTIPAAGYKVINTVRVDYRDDEGTRLRNAGKLIGPMPSAGQLGGVAASCPPGTCSFTIHCDDANSCTADSCNIIPGTGTCTGTCVNTPLDNGSFGACDDGLFCNGQES
ncbi:MAG: hypothetical protein AAB385_01350, partial [Planctomycetota bacterium]